MQVAREATSLLSVVQKYMDLAMVPMYNMRDAVFMFPNKKDIARLPEAVQLWGQRVCSCCLITT